MKHWTLDDIPWDTFDKTLVEPELVPVVKAASLVERNSADYAAYLHNVFPDDREFQKAADDWAIEEVQHGDALGRWAKLADPDFNFEDSFRRFAAGYRIPVDATASVRGSRSGELIARCVVETGTSSLYSALRDATREPVLQAICHRIAGDEFRHYKLFYTHLQRYLEREKPGLVRRAIVAIGRCREIDDDELAFAFHCANTFEQTYDRKCAGEAYAKRAFSCYRPSHIQHAVGMMLKAVGIRPNGRVETVANWVAWRYLQRQLRGLAAT